MTEQKMNPQEALGWLDAWYEATDPHLRQEEEALAVLRAVVEERAQNLADADGAQHWQTRALRAEAALAPPTDEERTEMLRVFDDMAYFITIHQAANSSVLRSQRELEIWGKIRSLILAPPAPRPRVRAIYETKEIDAKTGLHLGFIIFDFGSKTTTRMNAVSGREWIDRLRSIGIAVEEER